MNTIRTIKQYPFTIDKLKMHLRIFSDDENEYVEDLGQSACGYIEDLINDNICEYETKTATDSVDYKTILKLHNVGAIISVKSGDNVIPTGKYFVDFDNSLITFFEHYENVVVTYKEHISSMPYAKQCINLIVGDWYENREASTMEQSARNTNVSITTTNSLRRLLGLYTSNLK